MVKGVYLCERRFRHIGYLGRRHDLFGRLPISMQAENQARVCKAGEGRNERSRTSGVSRPKDKINGKKVV